MKNTIKNVLSSLVCVFMGIGVVAFFLWVINLAGNFKGF